MPYELQDGAPRLLARYGQHRDEAREQDAGEVNPGEYLTWPQSLDEIKLAKEQDAVLADYREHHRQRSLGRGKNEISDPSAAKFQTTHNRSSSEAISVTTRKIRIALRKVGLVCRVSLPDGGRDRLPEEVASLNQ